MGSTYAATLVTALQIRFAVLGTMKRPPVFLGLAVMARKEFIYYRDRYQH